MSEARAERGPRGRIWLYAVAFALVLVSAYAQYKGNLLSSLRFVWWSIGLSGLAVAVAVASLLVPGPKHRSPAEVQASDPDESSEDDEGPEG